MKTPKSFYVKEGKEIIELPFEKAVAALAKERGIKKAEAEEFIKDALKGDTEYDYTDVAPKDAAAHKASAKAALKLVEESKTNKQTLNDAIAAQEEAAKEKLELITKGATKGAEAIAKMEVGVVEFLQKSVGGDFVVSDHGLTLAKGVAISPDSVSQAISGINNGAEILSKARTTYLVTLGDAVNLARKEWGEEEGDNLVAQAIPVEGQGKHNVLQSASVMGYIDTLYPDHKERPLGPDGLSFTHLQEAKNYGRNRDGSNAIAPAKVRKILEKAVEEKLSCADMRELLKKARPVKEDEGGGEGGEEGDGGGEEDQGGSETAAKALFGYLYFNYVNSEVSFSEELREDILKEVDETDGTQAYLVMDLAGRVTLKPNGKKLADIGEPPVEG